MLHHSPILLTPYRADGLIDVEALERFVDAAYAAANLTPNEVDTGAVILTGAALERANARAVAELFAGAGGKFVCASAGHNLEGILAAHGRAPWRCRTQRGETLLHIDVGGGTTKLGLLHNGEVLPTAAIHVGGRLVAVRRRRAHHPHRAVGATLVAERARHPAGARRHARRRRTARGWPTR